jgi:hypothetical protein
MFSMAYGNPATISKYCKAQFGINSNTTKKLAVIAQNKPLDNYMWPKLARAMEQIAFGETSRTVKTGEMK